MKGVMIQGTSSDAGKSFLVTALCRILAQRGLNAAPFKSQNMSNNSYVTKDGLEIGRAQGVQAEAAGQEATVYMNPILLKPSSEMHSEVVLFGKRDRVLSGINYRKEYYETALTSIRISLEELQKRHDYLIAEGAGSPAEINLNDREVVNMKVAEMADLPVILTADIERGGIFASIIGTLALLEPAHRSRVKGLIVNKFRGDPALFESGKDWLEKNTGLPVLGIIPYLPGHMIEGEDSLSIESLFPVRNEYEIEVAVIRLPFISNYTDFEPFLFEEDVRLRFVSETASFGNPDAVIIPGTKSTLADLTFLTESGLSGEIQKYASGGNRLLGICGGYQMLGETMTDPFGTDSGQPGAAAKGLGLLPGRTTFGENKQTVRRKGFVAEDGIPVEGYEIRMGETGCQGAAPFLQYAEPGGDPGAVSGSVTGTYLHHLFYNDGFRTSWLNELRERKGLRPKPCVNLKQLKDTRYSRVADHAEQHLDMKKIMDIIEGGGS
ncbi:cobyric acid synthase [Bacillus mangrovi]|uniref:Cobyric acid synthase n=1 Tax=Metabacillus mangrovi TaxID=1491830 RepID=A0A7X2V3U6_9BACI|nr:cobyric acid synthase [Metabacillus mangrovi]MTH53052.1 cobyric acid synthase [Metabacillus mangrovi]